MRGLFVATLASLAIAIPRLALAQTAIQYVYDDAGRLIGVTDPAGDTAVYHYDAVGNVLSIDRHSSSQVSIISLSPLGGPVGTTVTIYGTGFSSTPSQNAVTFNGTAATVSSATATKLVVTVPTGATTGTIGVIAPGGSATSSMAFTVAANTAPTITSFTPTAGVAGTSVTISGTNFDTLPSNDKTSLNIRLAAITAATSTSLTTSVPLLVGSGKITVSTPHGTAVSSTDFIVPPSPYTASDVVTSGRIPFATATVVNVSPANKIGMRLFDGTKGQRISLQETSGSFASGVTISILNPDGTALTSVFVYSTGFIDVKTLPTTGTYAIVVDPYSTSTGSATLTLYNVPSDFSGTIAPGGSSAVPATVSTTVAGQNGALTFSGTSGQRISLKGTGGSFGANGEAVSILNPDGSALASPVFMYATGFIDVKTLPTTGTYTIVVDPYSTATGSLTLTLYDVPADFSGTITMDGSATVQTTIAGQNGALTFSGTSDQRISLQGTGGTFATGAYVNILKPDGTALVTAFMYATGFIDVKTLPTTGPYTIVVDPDSTSTGSQMLTLYNVPSDPTATLTIGVSSATLTTTRPGQNALATFSGTSGQQVTVHVTSNSMSWVTVALLKPDGSPLTSTYQFASSFNLSQQTLPTTGPYSITINPDTTGTGSITVNVTTP